MVRPGSQQYRSAAIQETTESYEVELDGHSITNIHKAVHELFTLVKNRTPGGCSRETRCFVISSGLECSEEPGDLCPLHRQGIQVKGDPREGIQG